MYGGLQARKQIRRCLVCLVSLKRQGHIPRGASAERIYWDQKRVPM